jgi:hypothetical protein
MKDMKPIKKRRIEINKIIIIVIVVISLVSLQRCKFFDSKNSQKIISQELVYDSINNKSKVFDVDLETTIEFKTNDANSIKYSNLSLVIDKSKFPLVVVSKKFDEETNTLLIKFKSDVNFISKTYKNDSLKNKIINSKVSNNDGEIINKDNSFKFNSLIVGYLPNDKAPKYE